MKTVTLWIDGKKIFADEGTTILEAARKNGIEIPTLCHHPRLAPLGHCRLCVVEVDGLARPVTACDNPAGEGMVVTTSTPRLQEMRRSIIEMSLSTHPYKDCLTCEKTGACELQEHAYCFGVTLPEQLPRELPEPAEDENSYILRDEAKCILCGRCLQVCRSGAGRDVYSLSGRGVDTRVIPCREGAAVSLEEAGCIFCGQCVDVCPVGALTEKGRVAGGREWALEPAPGVCVECSLCCSLERQAAGNEMVRTTVPREGERSAWLCAKGKFGIKPAGGDNVNTPLVREGDGFREAGYDEALQKTAAALVALRDKHGGGALAVLAGGRCSNEESYLLQKLARSVLGSDNIDLGLEPAYVEAALAAGREAGPGAGNPDMDGLQGAGAILVLGQGLAESHPVAAMAVQSAARFGNAALVRVGPDEAAGEAWESMRLEPRKGGEAALLRGIAAVLKGDPVDKPAKDAGVAPALIKEAAQRLAGGESYTVVTPSFLETGGKGVAEALLEAAAAAGQLARGRSRLLLLSGAGNARGILESGGTAGVLPGCVNLDEAGAKEQAAVIWGAGPTAATGLDRDGIRDAVKSGKIKGLFAAGLPDGFDPGKLNFLAVCCAMTGEVPPRADVVFPALPMAACAGAFTGAAGRVKENRPAVAVTGIKPGWELFCGLAGAMGAPWDCPGLEAVRAELDLFISRLSK